MSPTAEVLLVRSRFRSEIPDLEWAWFVPGGGLEPSEPVRCAAVREIGEESGVDLAREPLTHLAYAEGDGTLGDLSGPMRDDFFLARIGRTRISAARMEEYERAALEHHRWWSIPDLRRTDQPIVPAGLGELLADYFAAADWPRPRPLPW